MTYKQINPGHVAVYQPATNSTVIVQSKTDEQIYAATRPPTPDPVIVPAPAPAPVKPNIILPDNYSRFDQLEMLQISSGEAKNSTKRYSAYESLVGVSTDTPELISIVDFIPLIDQSSNDITKMTDAGRYFDDQVLMRELRLQSIVSMMRSLSSDTSVSNLLKKNVESFGKSLFDVQAVVSFLLDAITQIERVKKSLDLNDDVYRVDPADVMTSHLQFSSFLEAGSQAAGNSNITPYDIADVLAQMGFNHDNAKQHYSSTKMWLQLLIEYREMIRTHSLGLIDASLSSYKQDKSPGLLTKPTKNRFDVSLLSTYSVNDVFSLQVNQIPTAIKGIATSFKGLYTNAQFQTNEQRISALTTVVSREYRLSRGLAKPDVQLTLKEYGYTVVPSGNIGMLDAVIGQFGNNIGDVPQNVDSSLASMAISKPSDATTVLTFEKKYVEGDNGILTPGSEYFVDGTLKLENGIFSIKRLADIGQRLINGHRRLKSLASGLNLMMLPSSEVTDQGSVFDEPYTNPRLLFETVVRKFVYVNGQVNPVVHNDPICSIFNLAQNNVDTTLKSTLFLLMMSIMNDSTNARVDSSDTSIIDSLGNEVDKQLYSMFPFENIGFLNARLQFGETSVIVPASKIIAGLKGKSPVVSAVVAMMNEGLKLFSTDAIINGRTRYSGYTDTIILMVVFDIITNILATCANQRFLGSTLDKRQRSFGIAQGNVDVTPFFTEIAIRLNREARLNAQAICAILNTLQKASTSITTLAYSMASKPWREGLSKINKLFNDQSLIEMLFNRQQIMMLASCVSDLKLGNTSQGFDAFSATTFLDTDGDGDYDFGDGLTITDQSLVPPKLRNAIVSFLNDSEYSTKKAINKRIITVGIPLGTTDRINQLVAAKGSASNFQDQQIDVFYINVHKIDLRNPDIVFKPIKRIFELSRFPVRSVIDQPTFTDWESYVNAFPTRDYSQKLETAGLGSSVQYLKPTSTQTLAFDNDSYAFLTQQQRREIIKNIVQSYLLETYIRIMSGLDVSETSFTMQLIGQFVNSTDLDVLTQAAINYAISSTTNSEGKRQATFFGARPEETKTFKINAATTLQRVVQTTGATTNKETFDALVQIMDTLNAISRIITPLADDTKLKTHLLSPRRFDRVVSLIIDPDDFLVDIVATERTQEGKTALRQLIESGAYTTKGLIRYFNSPIQAKSIDTKQGDISFEKYFITLSTIGEDVT